MTPAQRIGSVWYVLRRGRPSAAERVLYRGKNETTARRVFDRERAKMRQGVLRFGETRPGLDPWPPVSDQDLLYLSEPMARTRW